MDAASQHDGDLWVVLTPSIDHEGWLKALARTAAGHGMAFAAPGMATESTQSSKATLYVTHDAAHLYGVEPDRIAVLMPQPETAAEATAALCDIGPPHSVFHASLLLARAVSLEPPARLFTAAQLARNPEAIALFSGMAVIPPESERGSPRPAVSVALGMYRPGRATIGTRAVWSERLFTYDPGSCIEGAPLGVLDLTGRPRTILYGPYLALPAGNWQITVRFAVDEAASGHEIRADWGHAANFVSQTVVPAGSGVYELRLEHDVEVVEHWQFRLLMMEGVFDGRMTFQGGTVERLPTIANDQPAVLTDRAG